MVSLVLLGCWFARLLRTEKLKLLFQHFIAPFANPIEEQQSNWKYVADANLQEIWHSKYSSYLADMRR